MSKEHAYAYEAGYRDGSINYELDHCPACKNVADLQEALAENAKLKKLVREIWRSCPVSEDDCAKCPHYIVESDEVWCDIPILMEQLGVLVNE